MAGQERFSETTSAYLKDAQVFTLLANSQDALQAQYRKIADSCNNFCVILATPEGVDSDTHVLKIDAVYPLTTANRNAAQLASFAVQSSDRMTAEQAAASVARPAR